MSQHDVEPEYLPADYFTQFTARYIEYQARFADQISERDKVLLSLVSSVLEKTPATSGAPSLLDVGCSTGNLLLHMKRAMPGLSLWGGDLAAAAVAECRRTPALDGVRFEVMDMLDLGMPRQFDIIVANAVAVYFPNHLYERALKSVSAALKPGGWYVAFEWLHPFNQDLHIVETSESHPMGLEIHFRPFHFVRKALGDAGFDSVELSPFSMPVDLPPPPPSGDGFEDLNTYTVKTQAGDRLQFRGALSQPWCHLLARKTPTL